MEISRDLDVGIVEKVGLKSKHIFFTTTKKYVTEDGRRIKKEERLRSMNKKESKIEKANKLLDEIEDFQEQRGIELSEALEVYKILAITEIMDDFPEEICIGN